MIMKSKPKRIAVIGAGISGVVTAAHLKREGLDVTVFERCNTAGGVWTYDHRRPIEPDYPAVLASKSERKYSKGYTSKDHTEAELRGLLHAPPGPCYIGLKNNVGTRLLATTLNPFSPDTPDFVSHSVLGEYIQDTASKMGIHQITRYNTEVINLSKRGDVWTLQAATLTAQVPDTISITNSTQSFDTIVVASGHYHAPRVPDIPGLIEWKRRWPGRVEHSKGYRTPNGFKNKNVLLIGASVSSTDIARELGPLANTIYQSHRNGAFDLPGSLLPENAVRVEEVVAFDALPDKNEAASFDPQDHIPGTITLKTGQKLCGIDHIILCTGYHITLPFLPSLHADATPPEQASPTTLVTDGLQLHNLHADIFYIPDPSLVFIGVPYFTATFTLFEFQAIVAAKVIAGLVDLPDEAAMRHEYEERVRTKGYGKAFHSLREREVEYVDGLLEWVNGQLEGRGGTRVHGHTEAWKEAKMEQAERMKALLADGQGSERKLEATCW